MNIYKHCIQKGERGNFFVPNQDLTVMMDSLINNINQTSILPMVLLMPFDTSKLPDGSRFVRNHMSLDYYYNDFELKFAGYPTDESEFHLTNIELETDQYNLFGMTVGSSKDDVVNTLHSFGFTEIPDKCSQNYLCFGNLDVRIGVHFKDNVVVRMVISVATYYLGNRLY